MLIAFCGIDGAGKTTLIERVEYHLKKDNKTCRTKQPTDWYRNNGLFRRFIKENKNDKNKHDKYLIEELALLAATDRMKHINKIILPKLEEGYIVLTDRYVFSTYAYMMARGINDIRWLKEINRYAPLPELTFYIDVPAETAIERIISRGDKGNKEEMNAEMMSLVRENFLAQPWGKTENYHIIDNLKTIEKNESKIISIIEKWQLTNY